MIIVSAGLRKSASTLAFLYQIEIIKHAKKRNGQSILEKYASGKGYRGNGEPSIYLKLLVKLGIVRVTYNFRDPRDAIISMMDHGKKTRLKFDARGEKYSDRGFGNIYTVRDAVPRILPDIKSWLAWNSLDGTLTIRYEDFICSKLHFLKQICKHINCSLTESELNTIIAKFEDKQKLDTANFNKGIVGRFKTEMTEEEI
jgi:hypothetical protein